MRCTHCGSTNVQISVEQKSGYSVKKGFLGRLLFGNAGAVAGINGKQSTTKEYHCLACGKIGSLADVVMTDYTEERINRALSSNNVYELESLKQQYSNLEWNPPTTQSVNYESNLSNDDFSIFDGELSKYYGTNSNVVIPNGVTSIGYNAFKNCESITNITIPNSVTSIDAYAFRNCKSLKNVTIPNSVTSIGDFAFFCCEALTSITIGNGTISIGEGAFRLCISLKNVIIGKSVVSIGHSVFSGCTVLESVIMGNSIISIGETAFNCCRGLTNISIPNSVTSIGKGAFNGCSALTSISIPDSVVSIGEKVFNGCSALTSISIPDSVVSLGEKAFNGCSGLMSISVDSNNKVYHSIGNCLIETASKTLIAGCETSVIPTDGSVTSIGDGAFSGCSGLTSLTIPDGVTSIGNSAFSRCSRSTNITIPNSVTSIGSSAFYDCTALTIYCEAVSEPSSWDKNWNRSNCPVVWGYKGEN